MECPCKECKLAPDCPVRNNPRFYQDCIGVDPEYDDEDDAQRRRDKRENDERRWSAERGLE